MANKKKSKHDDEEIKVESKEKNKINQQNKARKSSSAGQVDPDARANTTKRSSSMKYLGTSSKKHKQINMQPLRRKARRAGDVELTRESTINVVVKYQLGQSELKKFKQCFKQIDLDRSGFIDYDEFFEFIDETKTPFSESLFKMIDADSNGTVRSSLSTYLLYASLHPQL